MNLETGVETPIHRPLRPCGFVLTDQRTRRVGRLGMHRIAKPLNRPRFQAHQLKQTPEHRANIHGKWKHDR